MPLKTQFPELFKICRDPTAWVCECWDPDGWNISFRRSLTDGEAYAYDCLINVLQTYNLSEGGDEVEWALDKSKCFTTKSLYSFLTHRGVSVRNSDNMWKARIPLKIKIFLWQLDNDRLQTATALQRRGWKGSCRCVLCGQVEDVDHIFFRCSVARALWCGVRDSLEWGECPTSWEMWRGQWANGGLRIPKRLGNVLLAGVTWALWTNRNKMAMERSFPKDPLQLVYSCVFFLQRWRSLLKPADRDGLMEIARKLKMWASAPRPRGDGGSDIVEL